MKALLRAGRVLRAWFGIDPMMRKEFYGISRRWQTYAFRASYVAVLGIVIWTMWRDMSQRRRIMDYSTVTQLARDIFNVFAYLQYFLISLMALTSSSDMISKEVRGGTLGILSITPMSAWEIAYGKWKSCVVYSLIIVLSGVPILATCIYLGGVDTLELASVTVLTLSTAMMMTAFGLLCSAWFKGSYVSLVAGVVGQTAIGFLPAMLIAICPVYELRRELAELTCWAHPTWSLLVTVEARSRMGANLLAFSWITSSAAALLAAWVFLAIAAARTRKLARLEPRKPVMRRIFEGMDRAFERSPLGITIWAERAGVWDFNPLLWKELRSRITGKLRYFTRIGLVILFVFSILAVLLVDDLGDADWIVTIFVVIMILLILTSVGAGASAFTREKEERKWDILMTTPVGAGRLVSAKFLGALLGPVPFVLLLVLFAVLTAHLKYDARVSPLVVSTLAFCFFVVCVGLLVSLTVNSTKKAYALTLAVVFFFVAVIPLLLVLHQTLTRWYDGDNFYESVMRVTNPFAHLEQAAHRYRSWETIDPWGSVVALTAIYGCLGALCLALCWTRFDRISGRTF